MNPMCGIMVPYLVSDNESSMLGCLQSNLLYEVLGYWLLITGGAGFLAMAVDKARATGGEWRLPEVILFSIAAIGGSLGMVLGSEVFHHKSSKLEFLIILYSIAALWLYLLLRIGLLDCFATYLPH